MTSEQFVDYLRSWGLHFDTEDGESSEIPYEILGRITSECDPTLARNIIRATNTTDGNTYLRASSQSELEANFVEWNK